MRLTVDRERFSSALTRLRPLFGVAKVHPALSHVLLAIDDGHVVLTAGNLETRLSLTLECEHDRSGSLLIPGHQIVELARALTVERLTLKSDDRLIVRIETDQSTYELAGMDPGDYPRSTASTDDATTIQIDAAQLRDLLTRTTYAASRNPSRLHLAGVCLECVDGKLLAVATDGHRLAVADCDSSTPTMSPLLLPIGACDAVLKSLDEPGQATLEVRHNALLLRLGSSELSTQLIDAQFPPWRQILPAKEKIKITTARGNMIAALTRLQLVRIGGGTAVTVTAESGRLTLCSDSDSVRRGEEVLPCDLTGGSWTGEYNPAYLVDALRAIDGDAADITTTGGACDPLRISGSTTAYAVVMPQISRGAK